MHPLFCAHVCGGTLCMGVCVPVCVWKGEREKSKCTQIQNKYANNMCGEIYLLIDDTIKQENRQFPMVSNCFIFTEHINRWE